MWYNVIDKTEGDLIKMKKADPAIRPYNSSEWKQLDDAEKDRLLTNLVNRLNRRADRLEKAGYKEMRGYKAITELAERDKGKYEAKGKPGRLTRGFSKMTDKEKLLYYRRLVSAASKKTGTIKGAKEEIRRLGTTASGKEVFSEQDYAQLTDVEKDEFWKAFHRLRDRLGDLYIPGTKGGGDNSTLNAFMIVYKDSKRSGAKFNITSNRARTIMELMKKIADENERAHPTWSGIGGFPISDEWLDKD